MKKDKEKIPKLKHMEKRGKLIRPKKNDPYNQKETRQENQEIGRAHV